MTAASEEPFNWRLILACWAVVVVAFYLPMLSHAGGILPFTDNDDSMRMVTAGALADGQGWQDRIVDRDNAPFGSPMPWSRLVDAPIAGLLLLARPVLGRAMADTAVSLAWPPLMLLAALAFSVGLTRRMLGPGHQLAAVLLPALSIVVLGEFAPGRVDHHNVQIILTTALVWATISGRTSDRAAIAAGLLTATSLAVGVETLPFAVGAIVAFGLRWVVDPATGGKAHRFALALAAGTLGQFLLAVPPGDFLKPACDEISDTYVVATALAAAALIVASRFGGWLAPGWRLGFLTLLGGLAAGIVLALFPDCRAGPYGHIDLRAYDLLLAQVPETQSLWQRLMDDPVNALSLALAPAVGLVVLAWRSSATRGGERTDWLVLLIFLAFASLVMVAEVRGARLAAMPAVPAGAWLVAAARKAYAGRRDVARGGALVASWLAFSGIVQFLLPVAVGSLLVGGPAKAAAPASGITACYWPRSFAHLADLPSGNVVAPMTIGSRLLRFTADSVVSAGYHRNIAGAYAVDDFLNDGEATAAAIARQRNLAYVVVCDELRQLATRSSSASDSFVAMWAEGRHWNWLTPLSSPGEPLQIFRIDLTR